MTGRRFFANYGSWSPPAAHGGLRGYGLWFPDQSSVAHLGACCQACELFSLGLCCHGARNRFLAFVWSPQRRKTDDIIRCPYCLEDQTLRAMSRHYTGDWFICVACGHLALPANPFFQCTCGKCVLLMALQDKLNQKSSPQRGFGRIFKLFNKE